MKSNKKLERNGDENDDTCCDCDAEDDEIMIELWIWDDFKWYLFTVSISSMLFENISSFSISCYIESK